MGTRSQGKAHPLRMGRGPDDQRTAVRLDCGPCRLNGPEEPAARWSQNGHGCASWYLCARAGVTVATLVWLVTNAHKCILRNQLLTTSTTTKYHHHHHHHHHHYYYYYYYYYY